MVVLHNGVHKYINIQQTYNYNPDGNNIYIKLKQDNFKVINIKIRDMDYVWPY